MMEGLNAEEIAQAHFVAVTTVRSQIRSVLQKLGVRSQLAAVALADGHREFLPVEVDTGRDRRRSEPLVRRSEPEYSIHIGSARGGPNDPVTYAANRTTARVPAISGGPNE